MQTAASNIMASVFWDGDGNLSEDFLESGATFNCERNVQTLMKLKQRVRRVRADRKIHPVLQLLLQGEARPHTSPHTGERMATVQWSLLPHGPYSPDLAPPDFHLFGSLKEALRGRCFAKYDEMNTACLTSSDVSVKSLTHLTQRRKQVVGKEGGFVEKWSQLCKRYTDEICTFRYKCNCIF